MEKIYRVIAWTLILVGLIIGALRASAIRWWQVPPNDPELGVSLAPSLNAGDWVLLWRLTKPGIGSLVVCPDPDDPTNVVVGRAIAGSQDLITIQNDQVLRNGEPFKTEQNCTQPRLVVTDPETDQEAELYCDMESVNGNLHKRGFLASKETARKFQTRVGSGQLFLLSDNRAFPFDSRHFGTVPRQSCKESIFYRLTSVKGFFDVEQRLTYVR